MSRNVFKRKKHWRCFDWLVYISLQFYLVQNFVPLFPPPQWQRSGVVWSPRSSTEFFFTDPKYIIQCVELLDGSAGSALYSGHDVGTYVDFSDKEVILKKTVSSCKKNCFAECVDGHSISAPETLCVQTAIRRQPPKTDQPQFSRYCIRLL